jgi:hypothetical protein
MWRSLTGLIESLYSLEKQETPTQQQNVTSKKILSLKNEINFLCLDIPMFA